MQKINEEFICKNCGLKNPPAEKTCRNHCKNCLFSMHLDESEPGDRKSVCKGLMEPISIDKSGKKGIIITHKCLRCGKIQKNKAAGDDSTDRIIEISTHGPEKIKK